MGQGGVELCDAAVLKSAVTMLGTLTSYESLHQLLLTAKKKKVNKIKNK